MINRELAAYSSELADKPQIVVGTKIELPGPETGLLFSRRLRKKVMRRTRFRCYRRRG